MPAARRVIRGNTGDLSRMSSHCIVQEIPERIKISLVQGLTVDSSQQMC